MKVNRLKLLQRQQQADGIKGAYIFINERAQPFARVGIGRMIGRAGVGAGLPSPVHVHMLRRSIGKNKGRSHERTGIYSRRRSCN
jgi:site-specific recombinase XerD